VFLTALRDHLIHRWPRHNQRNRGAGRGPVGVLENGRAVKRIERAAFPKPARITFRRDLNRAAG